jgi:hypothetical protein
MITLQAFNSKTRTWKVRNAFVTENKLVEIGNMSADDLETKARALMSKWATYNDGRQLRVWDDAPQPHSLGAAATPQASVRPRAIYTAFRFPLYILFFACAVVFSYAALFYYIMIFGEF